MQAGDDVDPICGQGGARAREVLDLVSDKWSLYVVAALGQGPLRFSQARRVVVGISQRMLTVTLRRLVRDGLVSRTVVPTVPPQVTYALTETGHSLRLAVQPLIEWAFTTVEDIDAARATYDAQADEQT
ncbi:winged helix-turn-helix transcriptional regulator [Nocardia vermiculata]|uniref:Helix-turn-helix transcriptional regulator n=1 Tax=Nocardia vermiculata TaxID=257274 RepID=A0A846Y6G8_9NOCA|nr:helix-turn-helix domain-containing protein [Nocardia vermiculata]NKY52269.1 helix-turn-helix transcriptional regulator [Nocardia vermiculata]